MKNKLLLLVALIALFGVVTPFAKVEAFTASYMTNIYLQNNFTSPPTYIDLNDKDFATLETANAVADIYRNEIGAKDVKVVCEEGMGGPYVKYENNVATPVCKYLIVIGNYLYVTTAGLIASQLEYDYNGTIASIKAELKYMNIQTNENTNTNTSPTNSTQSSVPQYAIQTLNLLQDLINSYKQQLQNIANNTTSAPPIFQSTCSTPLSSNLGMGDSGTEVAILTDWLTREGLLNGSKTTYDQSVYDAVVAYQEKYASAILAPLSLTEGTGYVGPYTRNHLNAKYGCATSQAFTYPTTYTSVQTPIESVPVETFTIPGSFRYLRILTTERGWISWREVEVYDKDGNKIPLTESQVSASASYPTDPPKNAVDNNISTGWNSGEVNILSADCSNCYIRTAWFKVDLGSVKEVSKVKMLEVGDMDNEVNKIQASNDGINFYTIVEIKGPFRDWEWIEYPYKVWEAGPSITFTVNGSDSANHVTAEGLIYKWEAKNADYVVEEVTYSNDSSILFKRPSVCDSFGNVTRFFNPFDVLWESSWYKVIPHKGAIYKVPSEVCTFGYLWTIKLNAVQRANTPKVASKTITIRTLGTTNIMDYVLFTPSTVYYTQNVASTLSTKLGGAKITSLPSNGSVTLTPPPNSGITASIGPMVPDEMFSETFPFFNFPVTINTSATTKGCHFVRSTATDSKNVKRNYDILLKPSGTIICPVE
jgi:hypothetical protein